MRVFGSPGSHQTCSDSEHPGISSVAYTAYRPRANINNRAGLCGNFARILFTAWIRRGLIFTSIHAEVSVSGM